MLFTSSSVSSEGTHAFQEASEVNTYTSQSKDFASNLTP